MEGNPLEILGVPKALVARERDRPDRVLALAEGYYTALVKQYHPDRPHGDAALMAEFSLAIEDLRDPDVLGYSVEDLLDSSTLKVLAARQSVREDVRRDGRIIASLLEYLGTVNQYEVLGVDGPVSCMLRTGGNKVVVNVDSTGTAQLYSSHVPEGVDLVSDAGVQPKLDFRDGRWVETYLINYDEQEFTHNNLTDLGTVRLVGGVDQDFVRELTRTHARGSFSEFVLQPGTGRLNFEWEEPLQAWYLPGLEPRLQVGMSAIVRSLAGRVVNIGILEGVMPL